MPTIRVALSSIKPNPDNPRIIKDEKFRKLVESIRSFPEMLELRPIVVNADNVVLGGNMRLKACQAAGLTEVPIILASGLTDEQQREFIIKDNVGFGEWDWDALANEWDADLLDQWGLDVPNLEKDEGGLTDPDEVPDAPANPITKSGDLWILGRHRVLCGDSTKAEDVARLMDGEKADLCFTSPPYNSKDGGYKTDYKGKTKKFYNHQCDDRTEDEWVEFCDTVLCLIASVLKSDESPVVWNVMYTANCRSGYGRSLFSGSHKLTVKETICWDKGAGFPSASRGILSRNWELIFVLSKGGKYTTTQAENEPRWAKWDIPRPRQLEEHKATFPVDLATRAMDDFGSKEDRVYDPFLGSGTTLIAAEQPSRKCYGMEISPAYCDVIVKRWQDFTGQQAIHSVTGEAFDDLARIRNKTG
jgi:DNA modification methylase